MACSYTVLTRQSQRDSADTDQPIKPPLIFCKKLHKNLANGQLHAAVTLGLAEMKLLSEKL